MALDPSGSNLEIQPPGFPYSVSLFNLASILRWNLTMLLISLMDDMDEIALSPIGLLA